MTKGLVDRLLGLSRCILLDIADVHPNLRKGIERDIVRLETLASKHGEKVFTLFLPALGKIFDQTLEQGVLVTNREPFTRRINSRTKIPRHFQGIWRLFIDDNGCLKQDINGDDVRLMRTLCFAFKKYRMPCPPTAVFAAVKDYYDVDQTLPEPSQIWDSLGDDLTALRDRSLLDRLPPLSGVFRPTSDLSGGSDFRMLCIVQSVADRVSGALGEFLPQDARFRHGPGAVSDLRTGIGFKYSFPAWGPRLQHVFPASLFAVANQRLAEDADEWNSGGIPLIEGASKLHAVPKTQKGPRLIAAEPTCNQWCQQSVRHFLDRSIKRSHMRHSIDFGRQELSGELAMAASVDKSLATVDLSSASDRLSCWLIERLFRANWSLLSAMVASRTRYIVNDIDKKSPKLYKLRKFASMGSALTFPIQSLAFYMICAAAGVITNGWEVGSWKRAGRQVRVYGDDLIVPVSWMPVLQHLLTVLYLKINSSKTFVKGNFRESCGTDAYNGVNVSPGQVLQVYDESKLSTLQGVVDSSNNLFHKGLWRTSNALLSPISDGIMKLIPFVEIGSESFGIQTGSGFRSHSRKRWNKDLHHWQYQTFSFSAKRQSTRRHEGTSNLLQFFTEDPTLKEITLWESGVFEVPTPVIGRGWVESPE